MQGCLLRGGWDQVSGIFCEKLDREKHGLDQKMVEIFFLKILFKSVKKFGYFLFKMPIFDP